MHRPRSLFARFLSLAEGADIPLEGVGGGEGVLAVGNVVDHDLS